METQNEAVITGVEGQSGKRLESPGEELEVHRHLGLAK